MKKCSFIALFLCICLLFTTTPAYAGQALKKAEANFGGFGRRWAVTVIVEEPHKNLTVYYAVYSADNKLLDCTCDSFVTDRVTLYLLASNAPAYAKVFILDNNSMAPYSLSFTQPLNTTPSN